MDWESGGAEQWAKKKERMMRRGGRWKIRFHGVHNRWQLGEDCPDSTYSTLSGEGFSSGCPRLDCDKTVEWDGLSGKILH